MRLDALIAPGAPTSGASGVEVSSLAYDSREVVPGTLFFCVPGFDRDGHDYAPEAVARGAVALVVQRPLELGVAEVVVPSVREAMGPAAARFYGQPSDRLGVVGITGTNGKTTTAFLVRALLEADGRSCGLMGTVKSVIGGREQDVQRTTPEAIDIQRSLAAMLEAGDRCAAVEVSSHALELGRVSGIRFAVGIFTNLTQDHLDFHGSMDDYFEAKRRLFAQGAAGAPRAAVVNVDDPYGRRLATELPAPITFGIDRPASFRAREVVSTFEGSRFLLDTPDATVPIATPLPGRFNVENVLGAIAAATAVGVDLETIAAALPAAGRVPGRFERVDEGQDFAVLVDYAHTPDSLQNVLRSARELSRGRVICVFGCGGNRDRSKRPQMGAIAAALADRVIVTSDNPRAEEPGEIIREIVAGIPAATGDPAVDSLVDRRAAIVRAIEEARIGDVVLIAGKGHEQGQELADGHKLPFDDVTVARGALRKAAPV